MELRELELHPLACDQESLLTTNLILGEVEVMGNLAGYEALEEHLEEVKGLSRSNKNMLAACRSRSLPLAEGRCSPTCL